MNRFIGVVGKVKKKYLKKKFSDGLSVSAKYISSFDGSRIGSFQ